MALNGQALIQAPHLIHLSVSMTKGFLISPEIAPTGQTLLHLLQPLHFSGSIAYPLSAWQTPARHFLSTTWAIYSSLKYLSIDRTGLGAVLPRSQREPSFTASASSSKISTSSGRPSPFTARSRISSIRLVPSRQGTHFPQDSFWVKVMKYRATSTIQVLSS